jgi:phosphinothricin acetyltransferase
VPVAIGARHVVGKRTRGALECRLGCDARKALLGAKLVGALQDERLDLVEVGGGDRKAARAGREDGRAPYNSAMPTGPAIRDATPADVAAIQAIYAHHVLHGLASFEEVAPTVDEMRKRFQAIVDSGKPYIVAELDGVVAGYGYVSAYRTRSAYRFTLENSIYIDERHRGRGVGSALLQALVERCRGGPWRQMIAIIGDSANAASIGLHRKAGFRQVGVLERVGFKHGRWVDSVLMQLELSSRDPTPGA